MEREIARIISIKNGKKEEISFNLNENENEELIMQSMYEQADKKIKENYTVLIGTKSQNLNDEAKTEIENYEISFPNEIKPTDYITIMPLVKQIVNKTSNIEIINNCIRNGYQDYDYHDCNFIEYEVDPKLSYRQRKAYEKENNDRNPLAIIDLFLRKKLGGLTEYEEKVYKEYEEFNLEKILYEDNSKYALNNGNAGVITIFKDDTYVSTNTKIEHSYEHDQHLRAYKEAMGINSSDNIYIQLSTKQVACWIPTEINEYQQQKLDELMNQIDELDTVRGKVDVCGATVESTDISYGFKTIEKFESTQQVKEHINALKGKARN